MYRSPFENPDYCEKFLEELKAKGIVRKLKSGEEPVLESSHSNMQKDFKELCDEVGGFDELVRILKIKVDSDYRIRKVFIDQERGFK